MEHLERLEELESRTLEVVDGMGEMMNFLALELKQEKVRSNIVLNLKMIVDEIQNIGKELEELIDELP